MGCETRSGRLGSQGPVRPALRLVRLCGGLRACSGWGGDVIWLRYIVGRWFVHAGLAIMPCGRARSELYQLLELWGTKVRETVRNRA